MLEPHYFLDLETQPQLWIWNKPVSRSCTGNRRVRGIRAMHCRRDRRRIQRQTTMNIKACRGATIWLFRTSHPFGTGSVPVVRPLGSDRSAATSIPRTTRSLRPIQTVALKFIHSIATDPFRTADFSKSSSILKNWGANIQYCPLSIRPEHLGGNITSCGIAVSFVRLPVAADSE